MDMVRDAVINGTSTTLTVVSLGVAILLLGVAWIRRILASNANGQRSMPALPEKSVLELVQIEPLKEFDWKITRPSKYRPFKPIYHITMALQSDTPSELITIDMDYLERVTLRRGLISQHRETVHGCIPAGEDAIRELYRFLLMEYLPIRFPAMFKLSDGGHRFENMATGVSHSIDPGEDMTAALRILGETVEEDMFLLQEEPEGHRAVAFVCCFPSSFDPSSKLGKLLKEIHAPVPSYEKIGPSMERFFRKLEVGRNVKRINWGIQTDPDLFKCEAHPGPDENNTSLPSGDEVDIDKTYARIELQTLSRLPQTRAVLFSFKTYLYHLRELKEEGVGPQVADAIEGLKAGNAPGMWAYKGTMRWGDRVCKYLRSE